MDFYEMLRIPRSADDADAGGFLDVESQRREPDVEQGGQHDRHKDSDLRRAP